MHARNRALNIQSGNVIPGFNDEKWPDDYRKSEMIKSLVPGGVAQGEHMHHLVPADVFGAFVQNLNPDEAAIVINRANQLGIRVSNDPRNFVGLDPYREHLTNSQYQNTAHDQLDGMGLESSRLEGAARAQYFDLQKKIALSTLQERLAALPDFVKYIAEPSIDIGRSFRSSAQSVDDNKRYYQQELKRERANELAEHQSELGARALGVPRTYKASALTKVLNQLKEDELLSKGVQLKDDVAQSMRVPVRKAGARPEILELVSGKRTDSPGDSKERGLYIDSGGGDVNIGEGVLRSNGNGNGKHRNGNGH